MISRPASLQDFPMQQSWWGIAKVNQGGVMRGEDLEDTMQAVKGSRA